MACGYAKVDNKIYFIDQYYGLNHARTQTVCNIDNLFENLYQPWSCDRVLTKKEFEFARTLYKQFESLPDTERIIFGSQRECENYFA